MNEFDKQIEALKLIWDIIAQECKKIATTNENPEDLVRLESLVNEKNLVCKGNEEAIEEVLTKYGKLNQNNC